MIINDFLRNSTLISACVNQFKKDIALLLPKKTFSGINISQQFPLYMRGENPVKTIGDYSQYIELSYYVKRLQRENLTFNDFGLSQQEQETIESFLKTPDMNHRSEILRKIALKLESLKRSEGFESQYNELQKIGLTR